MYPLVVSVKVLELSLLLLLLSGLVWLFRLTPIELGISVRKSLRIKAPLPLVLLCRSVVYKMKGVLLYASREAESGQNSEDTAYQQLQADVARHEGDTRTDLLVVEEVEDSYALTLIPAATCTPAVASHKLVNQLVCRLWPHNIELS